MYVSLYSSILDYFVTYNYYFKKCLIDSSDQEQQILTNSFNLGNKFKSKLTSAIISFKVLNKLSVVAIRSTILPSNKLLDRHL